MIRVANRCVLLGALGLGLLWGCGDDPAADGDGGASGTGGAEKCFSPGAIGMCICEATGVQGSRSCLEGGVWEDCKCRPPLDPNMCLEGDKYVCAPCPGETEGKVAICQPGGTLDCACATDGGSDAMLPDDAGPVDASDGTSDAG